MLCRSPGQMGGTRSFQHWPIQQGSHTLCPQLTPTLEETIQMMGGYFQRVGSLTEHSSNPNARGVLHKHSSGKRPPERRYLLYLSFPGLDWPQDDLGPLIKCSHLDRPPPRVWGCTRAGPTSLHDHGLHVSFFQK